MDNQVFNFSNSWSFEYINAGTLVKKGSFQERKHLTSSMVLSQILQGRARQILNGKQYIKQDGMCTFIPTSSQTECVITGTPIVIRWSHINYYYKQKIHLNSLYRFPVLFDLKTSRKIGRYIKMLLELKDQRLLFDAAIKRNIIGWSILNTIMPFAIQKENYQEVIEGKSRLDKVFNYCEENYTNQISVERIAKIANLSVSRFHCLFRELTGMSPHAYIIKLRLKKAAGLLKTSDKSIDEISAETGFYDRYHFGKQFKKSFSSTPVQYRNHQFIF